MFAQPKTGAAFSERRLILLLRDLKEGRNVACGLQEIARLTIPESMLKKHKVIERVSQCRISPYFEQLINVIIKKNQNAINANRLARKVKLVENRPPFKDGLPAPIPCFQTPSKMKYERFPLKNGPGLHHSATSPFMVVSRYSFVRVPEALQGNTYFKDLYCKMVAETAPLDKIHNPTIDQVLDEMMLMSGPFLC